MSQFDQGTIELVDEMTRKAFQIGYMMALKKHDHDRYQEGQADEQAAWDEVKCDMGMCAARVR